MEKEFPATAAVQWDIISYSCAITACGKAQAATVIPQLLRDMASRHVEPSVISYTAAMDGLSRAGKWQQSLVLWQSFQDQALEADECLDSKSQWHAVV